MVFNGLYGFLWCGVVLLYYLWYEKFFRISWYVGLFEFLVRFWFYKEVWIYGEWGDLLKDVCDFVVSVSVLVQGCDMIVEDQENICSFVEGIVVVIIMKFLVCDKQWVFGFSDFVDKCDLCVVWKIFVLMGFGIYIDCGFSLKVWLGIVVYEKLERDLLEIYVYVEQEIIVDVVDILGVGKVVGYVDVFFFRKRIFVDWKGLVLDILFFMLIGWMIMGDVKMGDLFIGFDGRLCKVFGKLEIYYCFCYCIMFDDGQIVVVDNEYLWVVLVG